MIIINVIGTCKKIVVKILCKWSPLFRPGSLKSLSRHPVHYSPKIKEFTPLVFPQSISSPKRGKVSPFNCDFVSEIDNGSGVSYNLEPYSASSLSDLDGGSSDSV